MLFAVTGLLLATIAAPPVDVKGKWEGKVTGQREDGTRSEDTVLLILDQKDTTLTGSVGGNESDQHPITSGTIEENKIALVAKNTRNGREYRILLTVEGNEMKGSVTMGDREGQLQLTKRKE